MKAPDIPGKSMAQIARAPAIRINGKEWFEKREVVVESKYAIKNPKMKKRDFSKLIFFTSFFIIIADARISPRKKAKVNEG